MGFTKFDNSFLTGLMSLSLSGCEHAVILVILRHTLGFNRDKFTFSYTFLEKATGKSKSSVRRAIKNLIDRGMVLEIVPPSEISPRVLSLNLGFFNDEKCEEKAQVVESISPAVEEANEINEEIHGASDEELNKELNKELNEELNKELNEPYEADFEDGCGFNSCNEDYKPHNNYQYHDEYIPDDEEIKARNEYYREFYGEFNGGLGFTVPLPSGYKAEADKVGNSSDKQFGGESSKNDRSDRDGKDEKGSGFMRFERCEKKPSLNLKVKDIEKEKARADEKKGYGRFKNVMLTQFEYGQLFKEFGPKVEGLINDFSTKLEAKGYNYKNHYAALLLWEEENRKGVRLGTPPESLNVPEPFESGFDAEEFFQIALADSYRKDKR